MLRNANVAKYGVSPATCSQTALTPPAHRSGSCRRPATPRSPRVRPSLTPAMKSVWPANTNASAWRRRARSSSIVDRGRIACAERSVGGRVPPREAMDQRLKRLVREVAEGAERDDADEHHVRLKPEPRVDDQIPETGVRGDHLGRHHRGERESHADAHAREDAVQARGQHHQAKELPARGAETLGGADLVPRHGEDGAERVEQHDERRRVRDEKELRALADAEPDEGGREEGDRRHEAPELDVGIERAAREPDGSHQEPETRADRATERESTEDAPQ